jgi:riboflavin synthase
VFSGLVAAFGTVRGLRRSGTGARLEVGCSLAAEALAIGESVAVDGACLTVARTSGEGFASDVSPETLTRTTLGSLRLGTRVNLERAVRPLDRLGGHLVLGHVDATTTVVAVAKAAASWRFRFALPRELSAEVAEKGSVAVDGVSLTVASVGEGWFETAVVPVTLEATTLALRRAGDRVNLETDVLAKYVRRALGGGRPSLASLLEGPPDATD